jgi:hypothetical protein
MNSARHASFPARRGIRTLGEMASNPSPPGRWTGARRPRRPLLELDPELGAGLPPERLATARSGLYVEIGKVARGMWAIDRHLPCWGC